VGVLPFPKPQNLGIEWDADNRLLAVNQGTLRSEFSCDGESRRVRIIEKSGQTVTSNRRFLWCATEICEERNSSGGTVVKRHFADGVQQSGQAFFYSRDHLGSIRELSDNAAAIEARYDYDPYGKRSAISEDQVADFGFTGHYAHGLSGLLLAPYRAYDSSLGRWASEDPVGFGDGWNLYRYVWNNPVLLRDVLGLQAQPPSGGKRPPMTRKPPSEMPPLWRFGVCGDVMKLVFFNDEGPNPSKEPAKHKKWKDDFIEDCQSSAPEGKGRAAAIRVFPATTGGGWG
jgi:RHS repeat-associated protein